MVPTARSKRPETDEKGDRSEPGSMGANEKARRGDKQRSSRSQHAATVLHTRRPPRDVPQICSPHFSFTRGQWLNGTIRTVRSICIHLLIPYG